MEVDDIIEHRHKISEIELNLVRRLHSDVQRLVRISYRDTRDDTIVHNVTTQITLERIHIFLDFLINGTVVLRRFIEILQKERAARTTLVVYRVICVIQMIDN